MNVKEVVWSYSRLNKYYTCPFAFYQTYIEKVPEENNDWGSGGQYSHEVLEDVFNGVVDPSVAADYFHEVCPPLFFPTMKEGYAAKWVTSVLNFFHELPELKASLPEVIGVEKDEIIEIKGYKLRTIIDLELRDGDDLICWDWKSSRLSEFQGKKLEEKSKQLYLYSAAMKKRYGKYPKKLVYYLFREQKKVEIEFNLKDFNKAVKWMTDTIEAIERETDWEKKNSFFFCNSICGVSSCELNGKYVNS